MKLNFRKISAIASSVLLTGMTMGLAAAANYPSPFVVGGVADVAIVYGTGTGVSSLDMVQAGNIQSDLQTSMGGGVSAVTTSGGITDDEVPLNSDIITTKIATILKDNKIPTLIDEKISWDQWNGSDDYNVHEEIVITANKMVLNTTIDDNDFESNVALTNDKGLMYKYVFEEVFPMAQVGNASADTLYLTLLGRTYEIESMAATNIGVVTSNEVALGIGESYTYEGVTMTVDDVFADSAQINGEMIDEDATKKIDGIRVKVESVGYHSNAPETSKVILKIGEDISKAYDNGDEYVGEDEDDPTWVWEISGLGGADGYIGVKYDRKTTRDKDEGIVYVGSSYVLPEDFAEIKLVGTTDVTYHDFEIAFTEKEDLWDSSGTTSTPNQSDVPVLTIEGPDTDSIKTVGAKESSKMYLFWAKNGSYTELGEVDDVNTVNDGNSSNGTLEFFYRDVNNDVSTVVRPRYERQWNSSAAGTMALSTVATLVAGDSEVLVKAYVAADRLYLGFVSPTILSNITLTIGGEACDEATGTLEWLGGPTAATSQEKAEATDIIANSTNLGTFDNDVMNDYGIIIPTPEDAADDDEIILSIPDDQVYGIVSVIGAGGSVTTTGTTAQLGDVLVKDSEVSSVSSKNLVVVGGSCINSAAATVLGGAYCGASFTQATGIGTGEFMIKGVADAYTTGKLALVVAGYEAADTVSASKFLTTQTVDTAKEYKGTSSTSAELVVS